MTTISNEYGSITIDYSPFTDHDPSKIAVMLSGGADSALLLYHLFKDNQESGRTFKIFSAVDTSRPWSGPAADSIISYCRDAFDVDIISEIIKVEHDTLGDADLDPKCLLESGHQMYIDGRVEAHYSGRTSSPLSKDPIATTLRSALNQYLPNRDSTPTYHEQAVYATDNTLATAASSETAHNTGLTHKAYAPFSTVDKRWVAAEYNSHPGLLANLFPLTVSCTGYTGVTAHFTRPCKTCYWCSEKHWAFGLYDGGIS
jgi:hypothetical protein